MNNKTTASASELISLFRQKALSDKSSASARVKLAGRNAVSRVVNLGGKANKKPAPEVVSAVLHFSRTPGHALPTVFRSSKIATSSNVYLAGTAKSVANAVSTLSRLTLAGTSARILLTSAQRPLKNATVSKTVHFRGNADALLDAIKTHESKTSARVRIRATGKDLSGAVAAALKSGAKISVSGRIKLAGKQIATVFEKTSSAIGLSVSSARVRLVGSAPAVASAMVALRPVSGSVRLTSKAK